MLCMGAANEAEDIHIHSMHETWSDKTPEEAAAVLIEEDIVVTNQRDKDQQLKVLYELAARAAILYASAMGALASQGNPHAQQRPHEQLDAPSKYGQGDEVISKVR